MKRRSFLHKLSHAAAAPIVLPNLLHQALAQQSGSFLSNTNEPGRILVLIKLDGGNDGLNTVIPLNQLSELHASKTTCDAATRVYYRSWKCFFGTTPRLSGFKSLLMNNVLKLYKM